MHINIDNELVTKETEMYAITNEVPTHTQLTRSHMYNELTALCSRSSQRMQILIIACTYILAINVIIAIVAEYNSSERKCKQNAKHYEAKHIECQGSNVATKSRATQRPSTLIVLS